jgi:hypothetical protein
VFRCGSANQFLSLAIMGKAAMGMAAGLPSCSDIGRISVPLYRLLQDCAFEPDAVKAMGTAFEEVCQALGLADTNDALRDLVARKVIELAQQGERDVDRLRELTLDHFRAAR